MDGNDTFVRTEARKGIPQSGLGLCFEYPVGRRSQSLHGMEPVVQILGQNKQTVYVIFYRGR